MDNDKFYVDGEGIEEIISALQPSLVGQPKLLIILACLTIAIGIMNPKITSEELETAVEEATEWLMVKTHSPSQSHMIN